MHTSPLTLFTEVWNLHTSIIRFICNHSFGTVTHVYKPWLSSCGVTGGVYTWSRGLGELTLRRSVSSTRRLLPHWGLTWTPWIPCCPGRTLRTAPGGRTWLWWCWCAEGGERAESRCNRFEEADLSHANRSDETVIRSSVVSAHGANGSHTL